MQTTYLRTNPIKMGWRCSGFTIKDIIDVNNTKKKSH